MNFYRAPKPKRRIIALTRDAELLAKSQFKPLDNVTMVGYGLAFIGGELKAIVAKDPLEAIKNAIELANQKIIEVREL